MRTSLYFIADERLLFVKIGISRDPEARLHQLQAGSPLPLSLFCVVPGVGKQVEEAIHQRFAKHWIHREWFDFADEIRAFIEKVCDEGRVPDLPPPLVGKTAWSDGQALSRYEIMASLRGEGAP
jgi:hypothetical protein